MTHENVSGKISRLYVNEAGCNIRLDQEGDRYLQLLKPHANYNSLYALILAAASNRWEVLLRLRDYEPPADPPNEIQYIVVDYPISD